ncbi:extracellular solute-binding protein [Gracilibacillus salitolerans]|uniref:Extracellular solute-binding protein n=1 Tax=Gracilibacillus salitolerans TaxID=2663022 RepID=A0A5Q2TSV8_9BACI|nr:extracellular solute-binding protein [Gracilibacillus salitolerans]QGH36740.1 extracellular solute-binding protein [Gracilibacillus salitolerans]
MKKITKGLVALGLGTSLLLAGCGSNGDSGDGEVTLELFSNKSESIDTYNGLIEEFEKHNPNITIELEAPPEAETVIKTRLTKDDLPDIMSLGGNATYGELARAGVFHDFSDSEIIGEVQSSYVDMLGQLVGSEEEGTYGIPYATNANTVIFNKQKAEELGIEIPKTWDEFIAALETAKDAGETPIYFTLQEAWTAMPIWNGVAGNLVSDDFAERKNAGETTLTEEYDVVADRMLELLDYGHADNFGIGYSDGNSAFANGEGVFYIQGNWAIPEIAKANPDIELGTFALPSNNEAEENDLVSGVDVVLTVNEDTDHKEEALKFIEFMASQETAQQYIEEQKAFSAIQEVFQEDPVFDGIKVNFEEDRLTSFPDHYYPAGMGAENLVQDFLINQDKEAALETLDAEWDKVINR